MNHDLDLLHPYPFEKLRELTQGVCPPQALRLISLSIGEPQHAAPQFVLDELQRRLPLLAKYPLTKGIPELREAIVNWLTTRFHLALNTLTAEDHVLPVNGTREALFAFAQACINRKAEAAGKHSEKPVVVMPNPFYQIYEGATLLAGAEPYYLADDTEHGRTPDLESVPPEIWQRCQLLFICTPGNPTGAVIPMQRLQRLIELADEYDFIIASDECYSEIYPDESSPPVGLLQACQQLGRHDYHRCVVFHSLSKRSNLPGLRSGFVAGDADILRAFLLYRTYHGSAMSLPSQYASVSTWQDEQHVIDNRILYRKKMAAVLNVLDGCLDVSSPEAGFYLWPVTPIDDQRFTRELLASQNVAVLPGSFLARQGLHGNPGANHVRIALVASLEECIEAAERIRIFCMDLLPGQKK